MSEEPEIEALVREISRESPEIGKTIGKLIVDIAEGACNELVSRGIYPDKRTCVSSFIEGKRKE